MTTPVLQTGLISSFRPSRLIVGVTLIGLLTLPAFAQQMPREDVIDVPAMGDGLSVSNVFQSKMVLQRDKPIHVWGWAAPGEEVTVSFAGSETSAKAGGDRAWKVMLPAVPANSNPQQLQVKGKDKTLVLNNILVGDVWVLGGQSNMEFELAKVENGNLEIISANYPEIRILTVPYGQGPELKKGFARLHEYSSWFGRHFRKGDWDVCSPEIARELSAIGYVFARRVHMATRVPIGVIDASRGGTTVESWTPLAVLRKMDSEPTKAKLAKWDADVAAWDAQADLDNRIAQHRVYIERMTKEVKPIPDDRKEPPSDLRPGPIGNHNCAWGTHSINAPSAFGAGIMVDGVYASFAINRDHVHGNGATAPGITTSYALFKDGTPRLVVGSPGFGFVHGPYQYGTGIVEWNLPPAEAMNLPRFSMPNEKGEVSFERHYDPKVLAMLKENKIAHQVVGPSSSTGIVGALYADELNKLHFAQDGRRSGFARAVG